MSSNMELEDPPMVDLEDEEEEEMVSDDQGLPTNLDSSDDEPLLANEDPKDSETRKKIEAAMRDRERIRKLKADQRKALEDLRNQQNTEVTKGETQRAKDRLQFLLERTDIFSHFVKSTHPKQEEAGSSKTKRRGRTDDVEEEEPDETESSFVTRWTQTPPFIHGGEMKDYQIAGLNWLIKLYDNGINGILADEMGLGKTLQTLSFLCYLKQVRAVNGPHMIIVPKSTMTNWINEFKRWVPSMSVFAFHGDKDERARLRETKLQPGKFDAIVTTYEMATREKSALNKFKWRYIIIDEAHRIKNEKSVLSQVVRFYHSQNRLLITGTPLQNNLHELWSLLNFLLPDVFSSSADFDSWFDLKGEDESQQEVITRLHKVLRPFLLRRIKSEVAKGLPPKTETKLYIGMSSMQRDWYQKLLMKDIDAINGAIGKSGNKPRLLNILMQLRKVCNHPYLFSGAEPMNMGDQEGPMLIANSGKMVLLDKLLKRLKERGSRVLIFSQMTNLLDILEDYLVYAGYTYCRIDGKTTTLDRQNQIDEYNAPDSTKFVFLLSTRAGGLGINLATADTVILFDSDWNPQMDLQAQDRAHRLGQTKPVNVYRFVTEGSIEEKIVERAELKLKIDALVIQQGRLVDQNKALSKEEMLSMIKFGADQIFSSKDSTITDEDIDIILGKGQQKTAAISEKLKKAEHNLLDLQIDGDSEFDMWTFEGESYKTNKRVSGMFLNVPKRERKNLLGPEPSLRGNAAIGPRKPSLRAPKKTSVFPHQFYPKRMVELVTKEDEAFKAKSAEFDRRIEAGEDVSNIDEEDFGGLTAAEEAEKESLMDKGFGEWGKRDFFAFLRGCEKFGRTNYDEIAEEVETKSVSEVKKYSQVFWKRYKEIPGIEAKIAKVEAGEKKIQRKNEMIEALEEKMRETPNPEKLKINYGPSSKGKSYTVEEDIFLIFATHKVGYGNWDDLKTEIRQSWQFRFDWFFKTRTPAQLQQRTDTLIRLIQKDLSAKNGKTYLGYRGKKKGSNGEDESEESSEEEDEEQQQKNSKAKSKKRKNSNQDDDTEEQEMEQPAKKKQKK